MDYSRGLVGLALSRYFTVWSLIYLPNIIIVGNKMFPGWFLTCKSNRHAVDKKTGTAKYPRLQERQKLPSSTALLGHNHTLFKISNYPKTLSRSKVLY